MYSSSQIFLKTISKLSSRTSHVLYKNFKKRKKKKKIIISPRRLNICIKSKFTPLKRPISFLILASFSELTFNVAMHSCLKKDKVINLSSKLLIQNVPYYLSRRSAYLK